MSFVWTPASVGSKIYLTQGSTEFVTNVNDLTTRLGISSWTWTQQPAGVGSKIMSSSMQEVRNALDYVHTNNYCHSHNSSNLSADKTSHCGGNLSNNSYCYGNLAFWC